jgi:hypothetical protein
VLLGSVADDAEDDGASDKDDGTGMELDDGIMSTELDEDGTGVELDSTTIMELDDDMAEELDDGTMSTELDDDTAGVELDEGTIITELDDDTVGVDAGDDIDGVLGVGEIPMVEDFEDETRDDETLDGLALQLPNSG